MVAGGQKVSNDQSKQHFAKLYFSVASLLHKSAWPSTNGKSRSKRNFVNGQYNLNLFPTQWQLHGCCAIIISLSKLCKVNIALISLRFDIDPKHDTFYVVYYSNTIVVLLTYYYLCTLYIYERLQGQCNQHLLLHSVARNHIIDDLM